MFKFIKAFFHSIYFSYIGRFGGEVDGGTYYILWTIHINGNVDTSWKNLHVYSMRKLDPLFYYHPKAN